jgi:putative transposase
MISAATLHKRHFFNTHAKKQMLQYEVLQRTSELNWRLDAWSIFSNHYHIVAKSPPDENALKTLIQRIHSYSARKINMMDRMSGRRVWYNYWDRCINDEDMYFICLRYVYWNAVRHGIAERPQDYPFCGCRASEDVRERIL